LSATIQRMGSATVPVALAWRLASQSPQDSTSADEWAAACCMSFRRDAENGGRDDRAPQSNGIFPIESHPLLIAPPQAVIEERIALENA
jgi:hypothetical protein